MSKISIYLKSGQTITLKVLSFTVTKIGNEITGLKWDGVSIMYIDLTQIAAVIEK